MNNHWLFVPALLLMWRQAQLNTCTVSQSDNEPGNVTQIGTGNTGTLTQTSN